MHWHRSGGDIINPTHVGMNRVGAGLIVGKSINPTHVGMNRKYPRFGGIPVY